MKAFLLNAEDKKCGAVEIDDSNRLEEYYRLLNCSTVTITTRKVAGKAFDIIADDNGLSVEKPIISALDSEGKPALVGNLLFCNYNAETGEELSLTDADIKHLEKHARMAVKRDLEGNNRGLLLVMSCVDYY